MARLVEPAEDPLGRLADIFIGALGLTGAMMLIAVVLGALMAGVLFLVRSRRPS
jgi:hypothetical protein